MQRTEFVLICTS